MVQNKGKEFVNMKVMFITKAISKTTRDMD